MHLGLDAPVVPNVFQGRVLVKHAAVPSAHLVIGYFLGILDARLGEDRCGFLVYSIVDPGRRSPVVFGDELCDGVSIRR